MKCVEKNKVKGLCIFAVSFPLLPILYFCLPLQIRESEGEEGGKQCLKQERRAFEAAFAASKSGLFCSLPL